MALRLVRADDPRRPSVDLMDAWRQHLTACGSSPNTVRLYLHTVVALSNHAGVGDPLDLTRQHVIAWLGRPLKPWTRLTYWRSVHAWSAWLREFEHDPGSDLTKGIPRPATPAAVARPIDDATIERLLALRLPARPHAYVRLALYQALRVHEIAKIRGEDLDMEAGWLMVTGKGGKTQPIPIHPEIRKLAGRMPEVGY